MVCLIGNQLFSWFLCLYVYASLYCSVESRAYYVISTVAGTGTSGTGGNDLAGTSTALNNPGGVWQNVDGTLYISDSGNQVIRYLDSFNILHIFGGTLGVPGFAGDRGSAVYGTLNSPLGICGIPYQGSLGLGIADKGNNVLRAIYQNNLYAAVGTGAAGSSDGYSPGITGSSSNNNTNALVSAPTTCSATAQGHILIADTGSNKIRFLNSYTLYVSTVVGSGVYGSFDAVGTSATIRAPAGVFQNSNGRIYFSDTYSHKVRYLPSSGGSTVVYAGTGTSGFIDNCAASSGRLNYPMGLWGDTGGNLYIADSGNNRIRVVDPVGKSFCC
jgi:hypothetical protein